MRVTLLVLGLTCFIGTLYAHPLQEESDENGEIGSFIGFKPQTFPIFEEDTVKEDERTFLRPTERPKTRPTRPPQVHHNAVRSQGPFSGRLNNVVLNQNGFQKTLQRNKIEYSLNGQGRAAEILDESEENEQTQ